MAASVLRAGSEVARAREVILQAGKPLPIPLELGGSNDLKNLWLQPNDPRRVALRGTS